MTSGTPTTATPQTTIAHDHVPREELRLALVLNGGVSLAVWMGGVARELDLLVRSTRPAARGRTDAYLPILGLSRSTASVDVISGTSAGGINGAALALALVNDNADLGALRDLWAEQGRIDRLLRAPFRGQPTSLLRGDEYFLPELTRAMRGLTADFAPTGAAVDLTITTTLLGGALSVTTDGLGQQLPQRRHGAHFRFSTHHRDDLDDFSRERVVRTSEALGLAARCTAGFPFAFEPTFVPVESPRRTDRDPDPGELREEIGGRPNMWRWASWAEASRSASRFPEVPEDLSRYAVDGGLLANTPTREALAAVDRRPAGAPLRRAMMLVFPHAPNHVPSDDPTHDDTDPADDVADAPTVTRSVSGLLSSLTSQGSLTFVEEIDAHNRRATQWRGGRRRVLASFTLEQLYGLVSTGWDFYAATRIQAAARSLSERVPRQALWDFSRIVGATGLGQREWKDEHGHLPYVPARPALGDPDNPAAEVRNPGDPAPGASLPFGWGWGTTVALGVADAAAEMLLLAQEQNRDTDASATLEQALGVVSEARDRMVAARDQFDDWWWHQTALAPVAPTAAYWALRLDCYQRAMEGSLRPAADADDWPRRAVAALRDGAGHPLAEADQARLVRVVRAAWVAPAVPEPGTPPAPTPGKQTNDAVASVVHVLRRVAGVVSGLAATHGGELLRWKRLLDEDRLPGEPADLELRLLTRLLTLDAATWMLAETESPGTSQAIKLAQLSLVIDHWWAAASRTPDDKVAGSELNRFGGFLKQSWRINDWIWGRLDGAQMLCRLVLEPQRLLRIHDMTGRSADSVVDELVSASYGAAPTGRVVAQVEKAKAELGRLFSRELLDPGYLPELAAVAAYPIQQRIVVAELPALVRAIQADAGARANPRSRGQLFLAQEKVLLAALEEGGDDLWHTWGERALVAFDRAGIGREPLEEEARSDAMIQTTVTAAAALVTVADSDRLGVKALKPVTKAVRGAALLPYWLVTGLLAGAGTARAIALLGFAVGGVALVLGLFGVLGSFSTAATTLGAGVVIGAFAFAALRTGTLLHGVALLGVAGPLVILSLPALGDAESADPRSTGSLVAIALVVLGLILLASLPNPLLSPVATLRARKRRALLVLLVVLVAALAVVLLATDVVPLPWDGRWRERYDDIGLWPALVATAVLVVVAVVTGVVRGLGMRRWIELPPREEGGASVWEREVAVTAPSGVGAGWVAVYGVTFLALAWGAVAWLTQRDEGHPLSDASGAQLLVVTWWALLGAVFCLAGPFWITFRARRALARAVRASTARVAEPVSAERYAELARELERRGLLHGYLVRRRRPPELTRRGKRLQPTVRSR